MDIFLQQIINGLTTGSVYAVVALGYTMVYGVIQLINFAHGEVVMIGAMVAFTVITSLAGSGLPPLVIVLAGVLAAIPVCMAIGYLLERARLSAAAPCAAPGAADHRDRHVDHPAASGPADLGPRSAAPFRRSWKTPASAIGGAAISSVQIAIILLSVVDDGRPDLVRLSHALRHRHPRHAPRTSTSPA